MSYILKALFSFLFSLLAVSLVIFLIISLTPGDLREIHNLSEASAQAFYLDRSLPMRYLLWLRDCLSLNLGVSIVDGRSVGTLLEQYAGTTLWLTLGSIGLSLAISLPVGILLGLKPSSAWAKLLGLIVYGISSIPVFVFGYIVLAIIFGVFHFYSPSPPEGAFKFWPWFAYYVVPVLVLSLGNGTMGEFVRFIALETQQVNASLFIKAAKARGASLPKHFFRAMLLPIFSVVVTNIAVLLGGVVVVERIFNFHGLGWLSWEATLKRDFPVIMAMGLVMACAIRVFMLLNDLLAMWLDPRLRA